MTFRTIHILRRLTVAATVYACISAATASTLSAQSDTTAKAKPAAKADSSKGAKMDHAMAGMDHGAMMGEQHGSGSGWKELDAFHTLLAATFHPAASKNDLAPARAKAADLNAAAKTWAASMAPAGCDSPAIKTSIADVARGSQEFADLVAKSGDDAAIKKSLGAVHTKFETVEESCKPAGAHK